MGFTLAAGVHQGFAAYACDNGVVYWPSVAAAAAAVQVESRPELWGKYAAVLNRLQGCLTDLQLTEQQQQRQQQRQRQQPVASWSPSKHPSSSSSGTSDEQTQLVALLLHLVQKVEAVVTTRRAPPGGAAVAAAFAKGKEIFMSVLKRYRRKLLGSCSVGPAQQAWRTSIGSSTQSDGHSGTTGGTKPGIKGLLTAISTTLLLLPLMVTLINSRSSSSSSNLPMRL
jgi:hypothetical protein